MENAGRGRDRRHGQTVKAVTFFSSGTLTSHLSCLLKRKEEGETIDFLPTAHTPLVQQT